MPLNTAVANGKGILVMSLDFELYWGMRDLEPLRESRVRLSNAGAAVRAILNLFKTFEIHSTWATVGFLFLENREELIQTSPGVRPDYSQRSLSPYQDIGTIGENELEEPSCYAPSLVEEIRNTPYQEIGTHTFSHYYCLEDGQTREAFQSDLKAAVAAADRRGVKLRSIVFPRNQVNTYYLETCAAAGISAYRGAGSHWMYRTRKRSDETLFRRVSRVLNAYLNIGGYNSVPMETITRQRAPFNIPGTMHLRPPLMTIRPFQRLALNRVYKGLDFASQRGHMYHLWFHPEDFSNDLQTKVDILAKVLDRFATLRARNRMDSMNMGELADRLCTDTAIDKRSYLASNLS
jgi:peptidoglycan/xylan/chitin deacetylase (PgdA/CDA1 family)